MIHNSPGPSYLKRGNSEPSALLWIVILQGSGSLIFEWGISKCYNLSRFMKMWQFYSELEIIGG